MMTPVTQVMMTEMSREEDRGRGVTVPVQSEELRRDQDLGQGRENLPEDHAADLRTGEDLQGVPKKTPPFCWKQLKNGGVFFGTPCRSTSRNRRRKSRSRSRRRSRS